MGVAELVEDHVVGLITCEGGVDVVGVVTLLRGVAQVVLHGDQVVELSVLLGVHEKGEVEEDGQDQVEVEGVEGEVKEKRSCMIVRMSRICIVCNAFSFFLLSIHPTDYVIQHGD